MMQRQNSIDNPIKRGLTFISNKYLIFVSLNWLFFCVILIATIAQDETWIFRQSTQIFPIDVRDPIITTMGIFLTNLIFCAFALTLSGMLFFLLPLAVLTVKAWIWGTILNAVPTSKLLAAFPTIILEGEGYILAALAGVYLGSAILKPGQTPEGEKLSRLEAVKLALKECIGVYSLVFIILLISAIVEMITILMV